MLYPLFGGYQQYLQVPVREVDRQIERWLAQSKAEAEEQAYQKAKQDVKDEEIRRKYLS